MSDATTAAVPGPLVGTDLGPVAGRRQGAVLRFSGIPYAKVPAGADRFALPVPPQPWDRVFDARHDGPRAPAPDRRQLGPLDLTPVVGTPAPGADYLTATLWAPEGRSGCPVLVFLHGGGFVSGGATTPVHDGTAFARDGIVAVGLQYRIGVPGWLHVPGAPANRGLLDAAAGLEWVRRNIARFGGDPGNITLAGQSAGAMLATALLVTTPPGSVRGLISQSGSGTAAFSPAQAGLVTGLLAGLLGIPADLAAFCSVKDEEFVEAYPALMGALAAHGGNGHPLSAITAFAPVIDQTTLPGQPADLLDSVRARQTALLIGTNSDEGNLYTETAPVPGGDAVALGHGIFGDGTSRLARAHACHRDARTYRYEFRWRSGAIDGRLGAAHCTELPFVFRTEQRPDLSGPHGLLGPAQPPPDLADRMHRDWAAFITDHQPSWPSAQEGGPVHAYE